MSTVAAHIWKPSESRVVVLDSFVPVPRGATFAAPAPLNWPAKDPEDVLDYQFDIAPAVTGNDGDGIATLDVTARPDHAGDIEITKVTADGTRAIIWVAGGQPSIVYTITMSITTVSGRSINRSILLPVMALATQAVLQNAIQTSEGFMLTDHAGNPLLST
jgi:hypothetical protein